MYIIHIYNVGDSTKRSECSTIGLVTFMKIPEVLVIFIMCWAGEFVWSGAFTTASEWLIQTVSNALGNLEQIEFAAFVTWTSILYLLSI